MNYYFIANIKINDFEEYKKYLDGCDSVFSRYHGQYLAVDNTPQLLEGNWKYDRMVIIRFPSEEEFRAWYNSQEYQELLQHRLKAAHCDSVLVKGLDSY